MKSSQDISKHSMASSAHQPSRASVRFLPTIIHQPWASALRLMVLKSRLALRWQQTSLWLVAAICLSMAPTLHAQAPVDAQSLILKAHALSNTADSIEDYDRVISLCREASQGALSVELQRYVKQLRSWNHNRRGLLRIDAGKFDDAASDFEMAVALMPNNWRALHNRALSSARAQNWARALTDLDKVLQFKNELVEAYFHRAEVHREMGQFAKARDDYDIYIDSHSDDAEAYAGRGAARFALGKRKSAVADLYNAIKLDPNNASALTYRGEAFTELGYYDKAARDLRNAIQAAPNSARAYRSAAWLMATCPEDDLRNAALALEAAGKAIELAVAPSFREFDVLAAAQANRGNFDAAKKTLTDAMRLATNLERQTLAARLKLYAQNKPLRIGTAAEPANLAEGTVDGPVFR